MVNKAALTRAINRYADACDGKAFQGSIPRYESEDANAAYEWLDTELEAAEKALRGVVARSEQKLIGALRALSSAGWGLLPPTPGPDGMCHTGITTEDKCCNCTRIKALETALREADRLVADRMTGRG
jgi:hypothetical protein